MPHSNAGQGAVALEVASCQARKLLKIHSHPTLVAKSGERVTPEVSNGMCLGLHATPNPEARFLC